MYRPCISTVLAGVVGFISATQAVGQQACRPVLVIKDAQFSALHLPALERKWTAIVSVDASRCAANSTGHFEVVFLRQKEIGPELEFREQFTWLPPSVKVEVEFWADEAPGRYWIDNLTTCPCGG
jgi:hypothetical protein